MIDIQLQNLGELRPGLLESLKAEQTEAQHVVTMHLVALL